MKKKVESWHDPALCVGDVMHARTRPTRNVFHYPIFYLRLPLSQLSTLAVPGLAINKPGICQILNRDHGPKDGSDLMHWVKELLEAHGLSGATAGGEVILQTMPRLFGYLFNPVSFYFCHDHAGHLRAVVCEVSNTFGERHNYLVSHPDHRPIESHDVLHAQKVFHVSPFFPLNGTYDFRFGGKPDSPIAMINYSAEDSVDANSGHGQYGLRTWIRGNAVPLRGATLRAALLRFPVLTIGVIVRIHWQALRLWLRKVTFFSKPVAPLKETTS
jgi:DUF1365 family protein